MKKITSVMVILMVLCAMVSVASAAEKSIGEVSKKAAKATVNYPVNVVNKSVNVVGKAVYGTTETAVSSIKAFWRSIIGKGSPKEIVTAPINKGGETIKDAAVETVKIPYEAGKKTVSQNQGQEKITSK